MGFVTSWIHECAEPDWLTFEGGLLCAEGIPLTHIASRFGTPCYIYSSKAIHDNIRSFQDIFSDLPVCLHYAVKANSNLAILRLICLEGLGAEVVSSGELIRAQQAGFANDEIIFTGPGKTAEELRLAVQNGLKAIVIESLEELELATKLAKSLRVVSNIALRINPGMDPITHPYLATGWRESKFGLDPDDIQYALKRMFGEAAISLAGYHVHIGSQIREVSAYRVALGLLTSLLEEARSLGFRPRFIDLGGGFAIPYGEGERPFPLRELRELLLKECPKDVEIVLEPGRALVGSAGVLLTKVLYRKRVHERLFVVVDAGMNDLLRPSLYGAKHRVLAVKQSSASPIPVEIVGPICENADTLASNIVIPPVEQGDLLAVLDVGAYGFVMSSQYNSRPRPPEILIGDGDTFLIRAREEVNDLWRGEAIPPWLASGG